ncbi:MAG: PD-(D/E)XK nuclease family protein, partial [Bacteroidales bacterium]|nr:PD-(D/E)XK nuclease family protein [Bacteroidales bacterium]
MRQQSFIEYVCDHIERIDLRETHLCVVLPNMRLQRVLSEMLMTRAGEDAPRFLPVFTTVNRLVEEFSMLRAGDSTELAALLYEAYREAYRDESEENIKTPDQFWDWAEILLSDFNQIDNQLAPADEILHYVAEEKRIANWHLNLDEHVGQLQNRYLDFYRKLWPIYEIFTRKLLDKGLAYTGLAGREAARQLPGLLQNGEIPARNFYLFVGLNALTKAEESLIKTLVHAGKAEVLWNADAYYMEKDSPQEAGFFLRRYREDSDLNHHLGEDDWSDRLRCLPYRIVPCAQNTGQVQMAAKLLNTDPDALHTLIVLNDESLFAPLMNALPENLPCNVSLAGSLTGTAAGTLFSTLEQARENVWQSGGALKGDYMVDLLRNPLFTYALGLNKTAPKLIKTLLDGHRNRFSKKDFLAYFPEDAFTELCAAFIFENADDTETSQAAPFFERLAQLCGRLLQRFRQDENHGQQSLFPVPGRLAHSPFEIQYLSELQQQCENQADILGRFPHVAFGALTCRKILSQLLANIGITYTGNPQNSVNVTGMLETRGMAFDHVIMLSMNEGVLPSDTQRESFLLQSVKLHYHLPDKREQTAMEAHHFYSLLQNCRRATLLYHASQDAGGEMSRFLLQLRHESPQNELPAPAYPFVLSNPRYAGLGSFTVEKTDAVLQELRHWLSSHALSYSSLYEYASCPMRFYRNRIAGIDEPPQMSDEMDVATKGNVFHSVMEMFFKERLNCIINTADVDELLRRKEDLVKRALARNFPGGEYAYGVNRLAWEEILIWVDRYAALLREEVTGGELRVLACEYRFDSVLPEAVEGLSVRLTGFADRIDVYKPRGGEAVLRIVDYKTGRLRKLALEGSLLENEDFLRSDDGKQAFQLLMYLFLFAKNRPQWVRGVDFAGVKACICALGKMAALEGVESGETGEVEDLVKAWLADMLNPSVPIACT